MIIINRSVEVLIAILLLGSCNSQTKQPPTGKISKPIGIEGHYQWFDKEAFCEIFKQEFDFEPDSSFLYHAFCYPNNFDPTGEKSNFKAYSMIGKWYSTNDPLIIKLVAFNGEVLKIKIQKGEILNCYDENGRQILIGPFFQNSKR